MGFLPGLVQDDVFTPYAVRDDVDTVYPFISVEGTYIGGGSIFDRNVLSVLQEYDANITLSDSRIIAGDLSQGDLFPGWSEFRTFNPD